MFFEFTFKLRMNINMINKYLSATLAAGIWKVRVVVMVQDLMYSLGTRPPPACKIYLTLTYTVSPGNATQTANEANFSDISFAIINVFCGGTKRLCCYSYICNDNNNVMEIEGAFTNWSLSLPESMSNLQRAFAGHQVHEMKWGELMATIIC